MPVGEYTKDQIRAMADEIGLLVAHKPDSQDICFVSDGDYASYIEENSDAKITPVIFYFRMERLLENIKESFIIRWDRERSWIGFGTSGVRIGDPPGNQ